MCGDCFFCLLGPLSCPAPAKCRLHGPQVGIHVKRQVLGDEHVPLLHHRLPLLLFIHRQSHPLQRALQKISVQVPRNPFPLPISFALIDFCPNVFKNFCQL